MQKKTTRAFRTISEAGDELDLQPHVLRFWESKFPQIKPIKRGGGRRFYRPEDIEFLRGIKTLLHDEKHPIKDVQKLIRMKGPQRVIELGQSVERASQDKDVSETVLIPKRIVNAGSDSAKRRALENIRVEEEVELVLEAAEHDPLEENNSIVQFPPQSEKRSLFKPLAKPVRSLNEDRAEDVVSIPEPELSGVAVTETDLPEPSGPSDAEIAAKKELETALERLQSLRSQWKSFKENS